MKWYYKVLGGHTHVRVFMNGAKCGDLCFRNEEFAQLTQCLTPDLVSDVICDFYRPLVGGPHTQVNCINEGLENPDEQSDESVSIPIQL